MKMSHKMNAPHKHGYLRIPDSTQVGTRRSRNGDLSGDSWSTDGPVNEADFNTCYGTINVQCSVIDHKRNDIIGQSVNIINGQYWVMDPAQQYNNTTNYNSKVLQQPTNIMTKCKHVYEILRKTKQERECIGDDGVWQDPSFRYRTRIVQHLKCAKCGKRTAREKWVTG